MACNAVAFALFSSFITLCYTWLLTYRRRRRVTTCAHGLRSRASSPVCFCHASFGNHYLPSLVGGACLRPPPVRGLRVSAAGTDSLQHWRISARLELFRFGRGTAVPTVNTLSVALQAPRLHGYMDRAAYHAARGRTLCCLQHRAASLHQALLYTKTSGVQQRTQALAAAYHRLPLLNRF